MTKPKEIPAEKKQETPVEKPIELMHERVIKDIIASSLLEPDKQKAIKEIGELVESGDLKKNPADMELLGTPLGGLMNWANTPSGNDFWMGIQDVVYLKKPVVAPSEPAA